MSRKNTRYVLFWIKSSKGTNEKAIFKIPKDWDKKDVRSALERWCFRFGAWCHEENRVNYGWKSIKIFNRKELRTKYNLVCRNKTRIIEKWKILAAMFDIKTLEN